MSDTAKENSAKGVLATQRPKYKPWGLIALSLTVLVAVVLYVIWADDTIDVQQSDEPPTAPIVSIEQLSMKPETVTVSALTEVRPRWSAVLQSTVSGRVLKVFDSALAGEKVTVDTALISLENSQYVAELSAAELAVKEASLALLKAEKATLVAREQYKKSGTKPANDLAVHLPELSIAKTAVKSAQAQVVASHQKLKDTTVTAPFSGFITERFVSLGQSVNIGDALVKLVDDKRFELVAEVGRSDWSLLQQPLSGLTAQIINQFGQPVALAKIRQGGGFLDEKTRQYKIFLDITEPTKATVLSGDLVRVLLPGITVQNALNIPESALTLEGYLWHVDEDNRLQRTSPQVLFRQQNRIIIRSPEGADSWRIAITPLASFLPNQVVRPQ